MKKIKTIKGLAKELRKRAWEDFAWTECSDKEMVSILGHLADIVWADLCDDYKSDIEYLLVCLGDGRAKRKKR